MTTASRLWIASPLIFLIAGMFRVEAQTAPSPGGNDPPSLDGPTVDLDPIPAQQPRAATPSQTAPPEDRPHDTRRVYAPKEPPAPIVERPMGPRPARRAQWVPGYWEWDAEPGRYVWVGGSWQIAPAGMLWVNSRWVRDDGGWYRVPGFWSRRRDRPVVETELAITTTTTTPPAWRKTGPPAEQPDDTPAPAPGPNFFFVPGHYKPNGDRLSWKPGFWARIQPGWDWVPARWVRRTDGWHFREGNWVADLATSDTQITRRTTARPEQLASPPRPNEPLPPGTELSPGADRLPPPPPGTGPDRDAMDDTDEVDSKAPELGDPPVVIRERRVGMPFYMIRPPGYYPYGPGGVMVPAAVPPFVRRLLDRVLP